MPKNKAQNDGNIQVAKVSRMTRSITANTVETALNTLYSSQDMIPLSPSDMSAVLVILNDLYKSLDENEKVVKIEGLITVTAKLYSNLTGPAFFAKLQGVANRFFFLRTFVPLYYLRFSTKIEQISLSLGVTDLITHTGWCAGDAHLENFGTSINALGQAVFTVNDFDDAGSTVLFADVLRFIASCILGFSAGIIDISPSNITTTDLNSIVTSYLTGLHADFSAVPVYSSVTVNANLAKSLKKALQPKENAVVISKKGNVKGLVRLDTTSEVPQKIQKKMLKTLQDVYDNKKITLIDAIQEDRVQGGSGGLLRYSTLIQPNKKKQSEYVVIQFKEQVKPGVYPLVDSMGGDIGTFSSRLTKTLQYEIPSGADNFYQAVQNVSYLGDNGDEKEYLLRPRYESNVGVGIDKIPKILLKANPDLTTTQLSAACYVEFVKLARDEAYTLGVMHHKSATNYIAYQTVASSIATEKWIATAQIFADIMTEGFDDIGKQ